MRKVHVFIAMSLDGYIADKQGNVDWLKGEADGYDDMQSYASFIKDIDTVVMGWTTYHQIANDLMQDGEWYYKGLQTYVLTHRKVADQEDIRFVEEDTVAFIEQLKQMDGKDIWICGGPCILAPLVQVDLIDQYTISIIPTLLGEGIPLFSKLDKPLPLHLVGTNSYNGITDVIYERRNRMESDEMI